MKPNEETARSPESGKNSSPLRLALLGALVLVLGARMVLAGSESTEGRARENYATAASYTKEVFETLDAVPCRTSDPERLRSQFDDLPTSIESWRQTARVEPSEILRSLKRIADLTNCPSVEAFPQFAPVNAQKKSLRDDLDRALRSEFARLRRAQKESDREGAHASIVALRVLLQHHPGPLADHLARLERRYRKE